MSDIPKYDIQPRSGSAWRREFKRLQSDRLPQRRTSSGEKHLRRLRRRFGQELEGLGEWKDTQRRGRPPLRLRPHVARMVLFDIDAGMDKAAVARKYDVSVRWLWYRLRDGQLYEMAGVASV